MMINKYLPSSFALWLYSTCVMACPNCAGSTNSKDKYTVLILALFIIFTYIPFSILFKLATKRKKFLEQQAKREATNSVIE